MRKLLCSIVSLLSIAAVDAQPNMLHYRSDLVHNDLYHYNLTSVSPVFAGMKESKITFIGSVFDPHEGDRQSAGFMSYEGKFDKLNSGFGVNVNVMQKERGNSFDAATESYVNLLYNYQVKIGEDQKVVIGANVSSYQYNYIPFNPFGPPYQISDYDSQWNIQLGGGVLYKAQRFFVGMSVDNIARKPVLDPIVDTLVFKPTLHYFAGLNADFNEKLSSIHTLYLNWFNYSWRLDVNNSLVIKKRTILGISLRTSDTKNEIIPLINFGLQFKDNARAIMMLYSKERDVSKFFSGQLLLEFKI
ncbi:MAG TPA: type IX secretion system membrane protein PorP/SprF [Cyclobacteriaceae bacterium]|nr:type IX secretion system membrane protein PorP/SprF [Cyclobacteriaceae bacterium]